MHIGDNGVGKIFKSKQPVLDVKSQGVDIGDAGMNGSISRGCDLII